MHSCNQAIVTALLRYRLDVIGLCHYSSIQELGKNLFIDRSMSHSSRGRGSAPSQLDTRNQTLLWLASGSYIYAMYLCLHVF